MADLEAGLAGDTLSRCRLFRDLGAEVIGEITSSSNERFCDPGEVLFQEGDAAESLFVVEEGRAGFMLTLPNGHEIKILDVAPGSPSVGAHWPPLTGASQRRVVFMRAPWSRSRRRRWWRSPSSGRGWACT